MIIYRCGRPRHHTVHNTHLVKIQVYIHGLGCEETRLQRFLVVNYEVLLNLLSAHIFSLHELHTQYVTWLPPLLLSQFLQPLTVVVTWTARCCFVELMLLFFPGRNVSLSAFPLCISTVAINKMPKNKSLKWSHNFIFVWLACQSRNILIFCRSSQTQTVGGHKQNAPDHLITD